MQVSKQARQIARERGLSTASIVIDRTTQSPDNGKISIAGIMSDELAAQLHQFIMDWGKSKDFNE